METAKEKFFHTFDLYLAAAITLTLSIEPVLETKNRGDAGALVVFVFPSSNELYEVLNKFNKGAHGSLVDYSQAVKRLRGQMLAKRNSPLA